MVPLALAAWSLDWGSPRRALYLGHPKGVFTWWHRTGEERFVQLFRFFAFRATDHERWACVAGLCRLVTPRGVGGGNLCDVQQLAPDSANAPLTDVIRSANIA